MHIYPVSASPFPKDYIRFDWERSSKEELDLGLPDDPPAVWSQRCHLTSLGLSVLISSPVIIDPDFSEAQGGLT